MKQYTFQSQRLQQRQLPYQQTIQFMKLMEQNSVGLEQEILNEIDANPALERDDNEEYSMIEQDEEATIAEEPENSFLQGADFDMLDENSSEEIPLDSLFDSDLNDYYNNDEYDYAESYEIDKNRPDRNQLYEKNIADSYTFQERALQQLGEIPLNEHEQKITEYIIGNLDEKGFLARDPIAMAADLSLYHIKTSENEILHLITSVVQQLDPPGICARNLQECLLLQLKRKKETPSIALAIKIIETKFDHFAQKHRDKLMKSLNIDDEMLDDAINEIRHLRPYPIEDMEEATLKINYVIPDFIITRNGDELILSLNNEFLPKLRINRNFEQQYAIIANMPRPENQQYIKECVESAMLFITMIEQREATIYKTMCFIMQRQQKYFLTGDEIEIRPMVLKDIAAKVNMDISTISRVVSQKYVQTDFGTLSLKSLFSESVGTTDISSKVIKKTIAKLINNEDGQSPINDQALCDILNQKGYELKRRTVTKYREQLGFPTARLRKKL